MQLNLLKFNCIIVVNSSVRCEMARIIESQNSGRRIIKMSVDDIISIVKEYQTIVPRFSNSKDVRNFLSDTVIYIPEDV